MLLKAGARLRTPVVWFLVHSTTSPISQNDLLDIAGAFCSFLQIHLHCITSVDKTKYLFSENVIKAKLTDCFKGQNFDDHTSGQNLNLTVQMGLKDLVLAHLSFLSCKKNQDFKEKRSCWIKTLNMTRFCFHEFLCWIFVEELECDRDFC